jgi:hypothetical protein
MWSLRFRQELAMDEADAEAAQDIANDKLDAAIKVVCATPAHTISGLIIKARITTIDNGGMFDGVRRSIVRHLLALDGGVEAHSAVLGCDRVP